MDIAKYILVSVVVVIFTVWIKVDFGYNKFTKSIYDFFPIYNDVEISVWQIVVSMILGIGFWAYVYCNYSQKPTFNSQGWLLILLLVSFGLLYIACCYKIFENFPFWSAFSLVFYTFATGVFEESLFRGFQLNYLLHKLPVHWAVIISSLTFGIAHLFNHYYGNMELSSNINQIINACFIGVVYSLIYVWTRSLFFVIVLHSYNNVFALIVPTITRNEILEYGIRFYVPLVMLVMTFLLTRVNTTLTNK